jgi:hypothetical protein
LPWNKGVAYALATSKLTAKTDPIDNFMIKIEGEMDTKTKEK